MDEFTQAQKDQIDRLNQDELEEIDAALLENTSSSWRKVARVVGSTMLQLESKHRGLPDLFYGQRVVNLVEQGKLESQGNISQMRFSEVRLA